MDEIRKCLEICDKYNTNEDITDEEIKILAYSDLTEANTETWIYIRDTFYHIMEDHGKEWNDLDSNYPDNLYHTGYVLNNEIFITGYTGVAGHYWRKDGNYTIAKS